MADLIKTGLLGAGVFASYHAGKIAASEHTHFLGLYDPDQARASALAQTHKTRAYETHLALFSDCDAVIIAAPAITHQPLVQDALEAGCHVLVEKPLALSGEGAKTVADFARAQGLVLQVGHQERLVCEALNLFKVEDTAVSAHIVRAGPAPANGRTMDVSVIWDLMIHDIDLSHTLFAGEVQKFECEGRRELGRELDYALASIEIGPTRVKLEASRIAKTRKRVMSLVFPNGEITIDFLQRRVENTTPYDIPESLEGIVSDPLGQADERFFRACRFGEPPLVTGHEAALAVATAEKLECIALEKMRG